MAALKDEAVFKIFYFVGRVNPPQPGHIVTLQKMIDDAMENNATPIILLGSGDYGERSMKNPIPYELKVAFLRSKLTGDYVILQKTNPIVDISTFMRGVNTSVKGILYTGRCI